MEGKPVYDNYEISGCVRRSDGGNTYVEPAGTGQTPDFWTLYGHINGQGVEAIGDFNSREQAEEVHFRITGQPFSESYAADGRLRLMHAAPELLSAVEWAMPIVSNQAELAYASGDPHIGEEIERQLVHMVEAFRRATGRLPEGLQGPLIDGIGDQPTPDQPEASNDQPAIEPRRIRDTTRNLVESVLLDVWPRNAAIVDFGLDSQEHYEALYYPLRHGDITPEQLDAALGKGRLLTELVNAAPHNPHKGIEFRTSWDEMSLEPAAHLSDGKSSGLPSLSDIAKSKPAPEPEPNNDKKLEKNNGFAL